MDLTDLTMILSTIQTDPSEDEFQQAYRDASSLMVKVDDEQKLILYGLYKQSTEGEAPPSPTSDSLVEKHKWKAWHSFRTFPLTDAKKAYIYLVGQLKKSFSGDVEFDGVGSSVSTLFDHNQNECWEDYHELHRLVIQNNLEGIQNYIAANKDLSVRDENGLSALHHAADRGHLEVCNMLVDAIDNALLDNEGQTALDYAVICDHEHIIKLLSNRS